MESVGGVRSAEQANRSCCTCEHFTLGPRDSISAGLSAAQCHEKVHASDSNDPASS